MTVDEEQEAKVTTKGQITIPKPVRDELGLQAGDKIAFVPENGSFRIEKRVTGDPYEEYRGYLKNLAGRDIDELVDEMRGR
jgi:AbrB family looped-hinge helix DNA binding protein